MPTDPGVQYQSQKRGKRQPGAGDGLKSIHAKGLAAQRLCGPQFGSPQNGHHHQGYRGEHDPYHAFLRLSAEAQQAAACIQDNVERQEEQEPAGNAAGPQLGLLCPPTSLCRMSPIVTLLICAEWREAPRSALSHPRPRVFLFNPAFPE